MQVIYPVLNLSVSNKLLPWSGFPLSLLFLHRRFPIFIFRNTILLPHSLLVLVPPVLQLRCCLTRRPRPPLWTSAIIVTAGRWRLRGGTARTGAASRGRRARTPRITRGTALRWAETMKPVLSKDYLNSNESNLLLLSLLLEPDSVRFLRSLPRSFFFSFSSLSESERGFALEKESSDWCIHHNLYLLTSRFLGSGNLLGENPRAYVTYETASTMSFPLKCNCHKIIFWSVRFCCSMKKPVNVCSTADWQGDRWHVTVAAATFTSIPKL